MNRHRMKKHLAVDQMTSKDFQKDTYAHIDVFTHLLKDEVRTGSFRELIYRNKHLFKGKTVLDIGCGIGILSLFAAKAGAKRVIAVDCSNAALYARQIVFDNHYDHIIKVIHGKIQDVKLPLGPKSVDIIISDWMGYCLIYRSIIDAILFARDNWLKPGGLIFPDKAKLHVAALEDSRRKNDKVNWWRNVHGFNMKCVRKFALSEPRFYSVEQEQMISSSHLLKEINLNTLKLEDLTFLTPFLIETKRSGTIDGIVAYFSVIFSKSHTKFGFNTAPWSPLTHWMQTVFYFDQSIQVKANQTFFGAFAVKPIANSMDNIEVRIEILTGEPLQLAGEIRCSLKQRGTPIKSNGKGKKKEMDT